MLAILDRRDAALLYTALHVDARGGARVDPGASGAGPAAVRRRRGAAAGRRAVPADRRRPLAAARRARGRADLAGRGRRHVRRARTAAAGPAARRRPARLHAGGRRHAVRRAAARGAVARGRGREPPCRAPALELLEGLRVVARGWDLRERPFWRPSVDPAFLLGQLRVGANDRLLPGGRLFWTLVFGDGARRAARGRGPVGVGRSDAGLGRMARVAHLDRRAGRSVDALRAGAVRVTVARRRRRVAGGRGGDDPPRLRALPAAPARPRSPGRRRRRPPRRAGPPRRRPGAGRGRLARPRGDGALAERARLPRSHDAPRRRRSRRAAPRARRAGGAGAGVGVARHARAGAAGGARRRARSPAIRRRVPSRTRWWRG